MMMTSKEATAVDVLRLLKAKDGGLVSGQAVSEALKISRTAVWKQVARLKEMGFSITSSRARGYTLESFDAPFNAVEVLSELTTDFVGSDIYFYDELASTNITAGELAIQGAREGTIVIADAQSKGKGRLGRHWVSPPAENLYTSIILRPKISPVKAPSLTLVFAVAAAEAIQSFVSQTPVVKWPNDILLDSMKVSGILMEMSADIDRVNHVICGIGVNINSAPKLSGGTGGTGGTGTGRPGPGGLKATSLRASSGANVNRAAFARELYSSVEKWYKVILKEGFGPAIEAWRGYFIAEGKAVSIDAIDRSVEGICMGIDETGALLVREGSGKVSTITSGDMALS
ncbi:MAG: biotin--[acetyl-CoA-carboxylase] ligase [Thermodesulfobacteriota bacterium]